MTETKLKWYRQPMVWMVIAIPAAAVIMGVVMISISIATFDGLVEDDYYKKGKEINEMLARDEFALQNGIIADVQIDTQTGIVVVDLSNSADYTFPDDLGLALLHPTQSRRDVKLLLSKGPDGRYYSELLKPLSDGRWYFRLSEANWRLQKLIDWPTADRFELSSNS